VIAFTASSSSFDINRGKIKLPRHIHFLLCNTCYWCASDIGSKSKFAKCPSYNSVEVESMPIAKNELYKEGEVPAGGMKEFDVSVFPTHYVAGTVECQPSIQ
jgi:hypothetical protein